VRTDSAGVPKQRFCALLFAKKQGNDASADFALYAGTRGRYAGFACDVLTQTGETHGAFP